MEGSPITSENKRILEYIQNTIHLVDGRYRVSIPWKGDKMVLSDNDPMALKRLQSLEKMLAENPEIVKTYQETICKLWEKGYIRVIGQTETSTPK